MLVEWDKNLGRGGKYFDREFLCQVLLLGRMDTPGKSSESS